MEVDWAGLTWCVFEREKCVGAHIPALVWIGIQHMVVSFSLSNHCPTSQNPHNGCFSFIKLFLYIENTHMRTCPGSASFRVILRESFLFAD